MYFRTFSSFQKVKDLHNANFMEGNDHTEGGASWLRDNTNTKLSFKDKLVGEIKGAYRQAFDFSDQMDTTPEIERDISSLREWFAAVRFFR